MATKQVTIPRRFVLRRVDESIYGEGVLFSSGAVALWSDNLRKIFWFRHWEEFKEKFHGDPEWLDFEEC